MLLLWLFAVLLVKPVMKMVLLAQILPLRRALPNHGGSGEAVNSGQPSLKTCQPQVCAVTGQVPIRLFLGVVYNIYCLGLA